MCYNLNICMIYCIYKIICFSGKKARLKRVGLTFERCKEVEDTTFKKLRSGVVYVKNVRIVKFYFI